MAPVLAIACVLGLLLSQNPTEAYFLVPLLLALVIPGLVLAIRRKEPEIASATFDNTAKLLWYSETHPLLGTRSVKLPYQSVLSVRPVLLSSHSEVGHIELILEGTKSVAEAKRIGGNIPLAEMKSLCEWLKLHLQEKVHSTLNLDK